jgi:hypothetical protein
VVEWPDRLAHPPATPIRVDIVATAADERIITIDRDIGREGT